MRLDALASACLITACVSTAQPAPLGSAGSAALVLDEPAVKERSHAFFDAWDRGDLAEFDQIASPAFETLSHDRFVSKPMATEILRRRVERHAPPRTRTWKNETVIVTATTAVFIGEAVEHLPADGDRTAAVEQDGWHTLVWASERGAWRVVHYQWQVRGPTTQ